MSHPIVSPREAKLASPISILVIIFTVLLTALSAWMIPKLHVDTETASLLSPDLPFRQAMAEYRKQFPQNEQEFIAVVNGDPLVSHDAATDMQHKLAKDPRFKHVYLPLADPYFQKQALMFLPEEKLQTLEQQLKPQRQLVQNLEQDASLPKLLEILTLGVTFREQKPDSHTVQFLQRISQALPDDQGESKAMDWTRAFAGQQLEVMANQRQAIVICQPEDAYRTPAGNRELMDALHQYARETEQQHLGTSIQITGKRALAYEELSSALSGMRIGGILVLLAIGGILYLAFRSLRFVWITLFTLIIGLIMTAGFAALVVGRLNLISLAFALLYVGLGVDFAIHYNLRYRAIRKRGTPRLEALKHTTLVKWKTLGLCALSTIVGFLSFVPTSFIGVSELGIIAGGGMAISFALTLLLIPSIVHWTGDAVHKEKPSTPPRWLNTVQAIPASHPRTVLIIVSIISLASLAAIPKLRFNSDPLDLKLQSAESVSAMRSLAAQNAANYWSATILVQGKEQARQTIAKLEKNEFVDTTRSIFDFIPDNQQQRLNIIEQIASQGWRNTELSLREPTRKDVARIQTTTPSLIARLKQIADNSSNSPAGQTASAFQTWLMHLNALPEDAQLAFLKQSQNAVLTGLPVALNDFALRLSPQPMSIDTIPASERQRWVSKDDVFAIKVFPSGDLSDDGQRLQFVYSIIDKFPAATGQPIIEVLAAAAIVNAFELALVYAMIAIVVILLIQLRNIKLTVAVLLPLIAGGALTAGLMVLLDIQLNFANVIALPLLLGIGVDNGIHMVQRSRDSLDAKVSLLDTATTRGVIFSAATTLISFIALAVSPHPGTASMGAVLAIGMAVVLICTLTILPALFRPGSKTEETVDAVEN